MIRALPKKFLGDKTLGVNAGVAGENPKGNKEIWESRERCRLLSLRNKNQEFLEEKYE